MLFQTKIGKEIIQKLNKLDADVTEIKDGKMCNCDKPICPNPEDQVTMPRMGESPVVGGPEIDPTQLQ